MVQQTGQQGQTPNSSQAQQQEVLVPQEFQRHGKLLRGEAYTRAKELRVDIIGVGQIGSEIADSIYRMADWAEITLIDPDTVDRNNLVTQGYRWSDVGNRKVDAMANYLRSIHDGLRTRVRPINHHFDLQLMGGKLGQVVFMCVDNIDARKAITQAATIGNEDGQVQFLGDIRVTADSGQLFAIRTQDIRDKYLAKMFFRPEEAAGDSCAISAFNGTGKLMAGRLLLEFVHFLNDRPGMAPALSYSDGVFQILSLEPDDSIIEAGSQQRLEAVAG